MILVAKDVFFYLIDSHLFFPLPTSFCLRQRRLTREKRFILPCQASIIEDNDVGKGKIKQSLKDTPHKIGFANPILWKNN